MVGLRLWNDKHICIANDGFDREVCRQVHKGQNGSSSLLKSSQKNMMICLTINNAFIKAILGERFLEHRLISPSK